MDQFSVRIICLTAVLGVVIPLRSANAESLTVSMPESCKSKNMTFCFDNSNYPTSIVQALLSDIKNFEVAKDDDIGHIGYSDRQGSGDEDDCSTQSRNDPIYYIVDVSGKERVVVQMEGKFEQRYSVMWCNKEGRLTSRTEHFGELTVSKYKMTCENKYVNYDILVLSSETGPDGKWHMERATVKIPVCCACRYQRYDE